MAVQTTSSSMHMGLDGFVWWVGVVESRVDPLNLGRAQVRIFSWHDADQQKIPSRDLPWAHPILPVTGTFKAVVPPKEGDWVVGFFLDGKEGQHPVMLGIIPGIPEATPAKDKGFSDQREDLSAWPRSPESLDEPFDGSGVTINERDQASRYPATLNEPWHTHRLQRNEKTDEATYVPLRKASQAKDIETADGETWSEPSVPYDARYPFNHASVSESGHVIEVDDTPGKERLHTRHRSGTFEEILPDGSKVTRIAKDGYHVVLGHDKMLVCGDVDITVYGNATVYVKQNVTLKVDGDMDWTIKGNWTAKINGNVSFDNDGTFDHRSGDNMTWNGPKYDFD